MKTNDALYPIREVSNLTGVNAITLRAWERRYGLIEPVRTEGGHRLYTLAHIERIKAAVKLNEEGVPIGQVKARLSQTESKVRVDVQQGDYDYQSALLAAATAFDLEALSTELDQVFMDLGERHLLPLLRWVTQRLSQTGASAQSVFWSAQLLPRLYTRLRFVTRHQALHACKRVWLQSTSDKKGRANEIGSHRASHDSCQSSEQSAQINAVLAALQLAEKGIYALISPVSEANDQRLFEQIKASQCQGLVIVDGAHEVSGFEEVRWQSWIAAHPGLEFHYFVEEPSKYDLGKKLQCHGYDLSAE